MKLAFSVLLLAAMTVSCGNKNSSGKSDNRSGVDHYEDNLITDLNYEQEAILAENYLKALRDVFNKQKSKLQSRVGQNDLQMIERQLADLNVIPERRIMEEVRTGQVVSSYFDGYSMNIYVGNEEMNHSWRKLLKNRNSQTNDKLYEDLLQLRNGSSYYSGSSYYQSYRRRSGGGSYYMKFQSSR